MSGYSTLHSGSLISGTDPLAMLVVAMDRTGFTQKSLAKAIGCGQARISKLLNGRLELDIRTMADMLAVMGYELDVSVKPRKELP